MTIKNLTPQLKKNCLKLITFSSLLLIGSCTDNETLSDAELQSSNNSNWSTKSVELSVVNITAETEQSANPASNATDNSSTSRWSGFGGSVNLDLDLGSVNKIDFINIAFYKGDERTTSFNVYTSVDNNNWDYLQAKTSSGSTEGLQLFDLTNVEQARYIRLECLGNSLNDWNSILDIEVMGTKGDVVVIQSTGDYTSIPAKIQAEDYSDATEGKTQTRESNNDGTDVTNVGWIDSGESLFYDINVPTSGEYTIDFRLASASAGSKFDILKNGSVLGSVSADATGSWYTWDNANETVQLSSGNQTIEIQATGSAWNIDWLEFKEGGDIPPTVDPPTSGGDDVASLLIGDMWKITMPYDSNGNDSGNVSDPDDRNRSAYEYYDLNDASSDYPNNLYVSGDEVFFVAHCGGATTSGSIYPRCELRQLDSSGSDDLISFNKDQYLDVTVRAVQTPVEKPEVCMVQLKGSSSNEIIRVDFTKDSEGLHLTENEDTTLGDVIDYELGDRLRVRITLDSDEVRLQLNNLDNGDTYDKTWDHNDDEGYFKIGSYVQSSITYCEEKNKSESECTDDNRDAVGIVAVSNFTYTSN